MSTTIDPDGPPLSPAEVGRIFGVDPKTVTRWAKAGKVECFWTPGGVRRYHRKDIIALLDPDAGKREAP